MYGGSEYGGFGYADSGLNSVYTVLLSETVAGLAWTNLLSTAANKEGVGGAVMIGGAPQATVTEAAAAVDAMAAGAQAACNETALGRSALVLEAQAALVALVSGKAGDSVTASAVIVDGVTANEAVWRRAAVVVAETAALAGGLQVAGVAGQGESVTASDVLWRAASVLLCELAGANDDVSRAGIVWVLLDEAVGSSDSTTAQALAHMAEAVYSQGDVQAQLSIMLDLRAKVAALVLALLPLGYLPPLGGLVRMVGQRACGQNAALQGGAGDARDTAVLTVNGITAQAKQDKLTGLGV